MGLQILGQAELLSSVVFFECIGSKLLGLLIAEIEELQAGRLFALDCLGGLAAHIEDRLLGRIDARPGEPNAGSSRPPIGEASLDKVLSHINEPILGPVQAWGDKRRIGSPLVNRAELLVK